MAFAKTTEMIGGGSGGGGRRRKPGGGGSASTAAAGNKDAFHVVHKVPAGDGPYVRAKHLQLVEKDNNGSIVWFWKAINTGDRVGSALKDMAVVMKQQDRAEEAVEAVKSFRHLCPANSQESLDNILIELYKKCGRWDDQIELLKRKLRKIYLGEAFNGKLTKTARSHGKKFRVSIQQESSRILCNLGWAYMRKHNYLAAEAVYRKAYMMEPDANKACNLAMCLLRQGRLEEAAFALHDVRCGTVPGAGDAKTAARADELLEEIETQTLGGSCTDVEAEIRERLESLMIGWDSDDSRSDGGGSSTSSSSSSVAASTVGSEDLVEDADITTALPDDSDDLWRGVHVVGPPGFERAVNW